LVKIIALVKYSMDVAELKVDATSCALRMAGVPHRFGDLDKGVVEASVLLKEACGADLEVLSFGPPPALGAMKDLLAMGADEATLVEDPYGGNADGAVVVRVLEAAVRKRGPFDLLVCGFASDDGYSHQIGPRLAERLELPLVSYARALRIEGDLLFADRDLEESLQSVNTPLPAIVSVAEEAFVPRTVTLIQAMKAQKKPNNLLSLEDLGLTSDELDQFSAYFALGETGVVVNRQQHMVKGQDLEEMADRLIGYLVDDQVLVLQGGA
jgi:electron transfer flavoprotein beta subunit